VAEAGARNCFAVFGSGFGPSRTRTPEVFSCLVTRRRRVTLRHYSNQQTSRLMSKRESRHAFHVGPSGRAGREHRGVFSCLVARRRKVTLQHYSSRQTSRLMSKREAHHAFRLGPSAEPDENTGGVLVSGEVTMRDAVARLQEPANLRTSLVSEVRGSLLGQTVHGMAPYRSQRLRNLLGSPRVAWQSAEANCVWKWLPRAAIS